MRIIWYAGAAVLFWLPAHVCVFGQVRGVWAVAEPVGVRYKVVDPVLATDAMNNVFVGGAAENPASPSPDNFEYVVVKYNADGKRLWDFRFKTPGENAATAMKADDAGNLYVTGTVTFPETKDQSTITTAQLNRDGKLIWGYAYRVPGRADPRPNAIAVDAAGNVWIPGQTASGLTDDDQSDWIVLHYDAAGHLLWAKTYDGDDKTADRAQAIVLDSTGCAYVTGAINVGVQNFGASVLTVKYDADGNELWRQVEDSGVETTATTLSSVSGYGIALDQAGNVVVGASGKFYPIGQVPVGFYLTFKYEPVRGDLQWKKLDEIRGSPVAMALGPNGNVYVTGSMAISSGTISDFLTIAYDPDGNLLWESRYNPPDATPQNGDNASGIAVDAGGNIYVIGDTDFGYYVTVKYYSDGKPAWAIPDKGIIVTKPSAITIDKAGDVVVTGRVSSLYVTVKYSDRPK
jgi:hypothetical protein